MNWPVLVHRAGVGPVRGWALLAAGALYNLGWIALAVGTFWLDQRKHRDRQKSVAMG
jgi:hypothetical protein